MPRTLALTGATGFIGSALLGHLTASGWRVRALYRARGKRCEDPSVEWVPGALEEPESLERLVHQTDAVVHCAGRVRARSAADFMQVNAEGAACLARALSQQARPPRLLLVSSLAAREPGLSAYAASKRRGEEMVAQIARTAPRPVPWAVLRPPAVYGLGDRDVLPLMRWMGRGVGLTLGPPGARFSLLYVDDLAAAVRHWLDAPSDTTGIFEVHDGQPGGYSWEELARRIGELRGRRVRRIRVPAAALSGLARVNALLAASKGRVPMLTAGKVRELRHSDWVCDNTRFTQATGWRPENTLEDGLRRTLGWASIAARGRSGSLAARTGGGHHRGSGG